jgi:hypothetical protein
MSPDRRYTVVWRVNGRVTATLENVPAEQAYDEAVPGEALLPLPGNRWHVLMRQPALTRMLFLGGAEEISIAYQENSQTPGLDVEQITVQLCRMN